MRDKREGCRDRPFSVQTNVFRGRSSLEKLLGAQTKPDSRSAPCKEKSDSLKHIFGSRNSGSKRNHRPRYSVKAASSCCNTLAASRARRQGQIGSLFGSELLPPESPARPRNLQAVLNTLLGESPGDGGREEVVPDSEESSEAAGEEAVEDGEASSEGSGRGRRRAEPPEAGGPRARGGLGAQREFIARLPVRRAQGGAAGGGYGDALKRALAGEKRAREEGESAGGARRRMRVLSVQAEGRLLNCVARSTGDHGSVFILILPTKCACHVDIREDLEITVEPPWTEFASPSLAHPVLCCRYVS